MATLNKSVIHLALHTCDQIKGAIHMLEFEDIKQAFENAIKTVGIDRFKKSSLFMSNHKNTAVPQEESKAA